MAEQSVLAILRDYSYVEDFLRVRDEVVRLHGWVHEPDDMWCYVRPPGFLSQPQGWKIHVSATPRSAVPVLTAVSEVLLARRVAFKFAKGLEQLRLLLSLRCDRGAGGKFITVYPDGTEQFTELLAELHQATEGMAGPAILSDRRYRPDSLVHYRYGGFVGDQQVLELDGSYVPMLVSPDAGWVRDERLAWYAPPAWAPPPLPDPVPPRPAAERGKAKVMLDGRFVVYEAIRHSNRGGVYRAIDEDTGDKVVIKEARPFVAAELDGTDARDFLRNEYDTLQLLEPLGVATKPVALFEYQQHTFLAEREVPGVTLLQWVEDAIKPVPERALPLASAVRVANALIELVAAVHDKGLVFRDLTPNNVMITPDDQLVLIDTEFLAVTGTPVIRVMTRGYVAPEELSGPLSYPAPPPSADMYSLGAFLFYLCTGAHALLPEDEPPPRPGSESTGPRRPHNERIEFLVRAVATTNPTLNALGAIVLGLMWDDPTERLELHQVRQMLDAVGPTESEVPLRLSLDDQDRLLDDGVAHLVAAMTPQHPRQLWPAGLLEGRLFDTYSLQAGAPGPIELLRRAAAARDDEHLLAAVRTAVSSLDKRLADDRRVLPGLYFGRGGTYWAMYEAAQDIGDDELAARVLDRAKQLPVKWNNPDITHGVAGSGMAQLHLWRCSGDAELRERVLICADSVLAARADNSIVWPMLGTSQPAAEGMTHYGFAHGVAGICAFLLAAGRELDRPDLSQVAVDGGDYLLTLAKPRGDGLLWPVAQKESEGASRFDGVCWWCSGAPGVGTFLIRLWRATGDQRFLDAARGAAVATRAEQWLLSTSHCHGIAGNGEFLLDMAAATGSARYREWAEEHAIALYRLCGLRGGLLVPLDDSSTGVSYSYNIGMSGPLGFLHRLRHGGERWWMVDDFALPARRVR